MTIIEIILVLLWIGVVVFWPGVKKTGNPLSKPRAVVLAALAVALLVLIF